MSGTKIKTVSALLRIIPALKKRGNTVVFTNGCFDILHLGHVRYLEKAKRLGDILIVGLNSDTSVKRIKGDTRPIVPERDRAGVLAALESVNYVVTFNEDTPLRLIQKIKPDVLVKGADWPNDMIVGAEVVRGCGGRVRTITLLKGRSTSHILKKIVNAHIRGT